MDKVIRKVAPLGLPGVLLAIAIATTGFAGGRTLQLNLRLFNCKRSLSILAAQLKSDRFYINIMFACIDIALMAGLSTLFAFDQRKLVKPAPTTTLTIGFRYYRN